MPHSSKPETFSASVTSVTPATKIGTEKSHNTGMQICPDDLGTKETGPKQPVLRVSHIKIILKMYYLQLYRLIIKSK